MKLFIQKEKLIDEDKQKLKEVYDFLEKFLEGKKFITGETYNIADFSVYTTGTTLVVSRNITYNFFITVLLGF